MILVTFYQSRQYEKQHYEYEQELLEHQKKQTAYAASRTSTLNWDPNNRLGNVPLIRQMSDGIEKRLKRKKNGKDSGGKDSGSESPENSKPKVQVLDYNSSENNTPAAVLGAGIAGGVAGGVAGGMIGTNLIFYSIVIPVFEVLNGRSQNIWISGVATLLKSAHKARFLETSETRDTIV